MKKIVAIFCVFFCLPAIAVIDENIVNGCDSTTLYATNGHTILRPTFTPNTYTCMAGYFLPANTDGCKPCPSGYTCPGRTFSADSLNAKGINSIPKFTQSTNNTCSANFVFADSTHRVKLLPTFVPNDPDVITVYFNNNGTVETKTCDLDGELTLPPAPTRVGYVFTGWKVKNVEQ